MSYTEKYGPDTFEVGDIISWLKKFEPNGTDYDYAAIKTDKFWYTTSGDRFSWEHLLQEINRDNLYSFNLWRATGWEQYEPPKS